MRRKRKKVFNITESTLDRALNKAEEYVATGNDVYITTDENEKIKLTVIKKKSLGKKQTDSEKT